MLIASALLAAKTGLVVALRQQLVIEMFAEQLVDELGHGAAAAAMAHVHDAMLEIEAAA